MKRWIGLSVWFAAILCGLLVQDWKLQQAQQLVDPEYRLVICTGWAGIDVSQRMIAAREMYRRQHPDHAVELLVTAKNMDVFIASGSHGADLVYANTNTVQRPELYEDLSAYPQIMQPLSAHWIASGAMKDAQGRIVCLPDRASLATFSSLLFARDADAIAQICLYLPEGGVSYDAFRALAQQAKDAGRIFLAIDKYARHIPDAYAALYPDAQGFDTAEFREMLAFWKEMQDSGFVVFADNVDLSGALMTCSCGSVMDTGKHSIDLRPAAILSGDTLYFPSENGNDAVYIPAWAWYMPADGTQKQLAAEMLAYLASPKVQTRLEDGGTGMMLTDMTKYRNWRRWTWQQVRGYTVFPGLNAQGYPRWTALLEDAVQPAWQQDERAAFSALAPQYFAGEISLDELLAQLSTP